MEKFIFFWKSESPFSQWYPARFAIDGIEFNCAEQYMMYSKAMLFGDEETAQRILSSSSPEQQKRLGRKVKGFDRKIWDDNCYDIVYRANRAKFTQNPDLLNRLIKADGSFVEASPYDKIWGAGLSADDPGIYNRDNWQGSNILGEILSKLRDDLTAKNF